MIEAPQSFIVRSECEKAAWQNGFRRSIGEVNGWLHFSSTVVTEDIFLAAEGSLGPWYLALDNQSIFEELNVAKDSIEGPGNVICRCEKLEELYDILPRVYQLAASLPNAPFKEFVKLTASMPQTTEKERRTIQRVGQNIFRESLLKYWRGQCPITGISDQPLLKASHIMPWSVCPTDEARLDVYNGLLLSALWDAAFDQGLVTFDKSGTPVYSSTLSDQAKSKLVCYKPIPLTKKHEKWIEWHQREQFRP